MNWREAIIKKRTCHCCEDCVRFQDEKNVRSSSAQNYRTPQSCRTLQDERDGYSKNYVTPENGNCGGENGYRPKGIPDPKIHVDHKMTKILKDFRHRAASFMEEQEPTASSDDEDVCKTFTRRKDPLREGSSVRRTPKLDYSPQSNFLKKMKRERKEFSPNSFINCGRTDNRPDDVPLLSHKRSLDDLRIPVPENLPSEKCSHKEKPTPRSELSTVRGPCSCYRPWRTKPDDFRSDEKERGIGNCDEVPDLKMLRELCNDLVSECEEKTASKPKEKSRRLSRADQKKRAERRGKKKYGEEGSVKELAFEPSLKRPHPNSCERCWRFASPSRSPVNKPNQRFDPNFRRTHSETTCTNADTGRSESSRDFKDFTAKKWEADREIKERLSSSHISRNSKTFLNILKSTRERPASAELPSGKRTVKLKDKERKSSAKTKQTESSKPKAPRPGRDMFQKYSASSDKPKTGEHLVQKQDPLQCSPSMFSRSRKSAPSSRDSSPKSATSGRSKSKKKVTKKYKQKQRADSIDRMLDSSGGLDGAFHAAKTCCCKRERRKPHHTFDQSSSCENFQSFFGNSCSHNRADHGVWNEPAFPSRPRTRCSHSPPNSHRHIYSGMYSNEDITLKMNELEDDYKCKCCCCFVNDCSPRSTLRGKCPDDDYFVKRSPAPLWESGMCCRENANPENWKTHSKCKPSGGVMQNGAADFANNPRKYCVFYMNKSNENKGDDDIEVLIEELTEEKGAKGACVNRVNTPRCKRTSSTADSRNEALRNKMKKMKELRLDSMALRFQKGVAEKCTRPESSRVLYF